MSQIKLKKETQKQIYDTIDYFLSKSHNWPKITKKQERVPKSKKKDITQGVPSKGVIWEFPANIPDDNLDVLINWDRF